MHNCRYGMGDYFEFNRAYFQWGLIYRRVKLKRFHRYLFPVVILVFTLSSCSSLGRQPTSWIYKSSSNIFYIKWTNNNGNIGGSFLSATSNQRNASTPITSDNTNFTGLISNGNITINLSGSETLTGTINNSSLSLNFPLGSNLVQAVFSPGQPKDFNDAVSKLTAETNTSNQRAKQKGVDDGFVNAIAQLPHLEADVSAATSKINSTRVALDSAFNAEVSYINSALTGSCQTDTQYTHASDLYNAVSSASTNYISSIDSLNYATSALTTNNNTFATESSNFSSSIMTKENNAALVKGENIQTNALKLLSDAKSRDAEVWDSAGAILDKFSKFTSCP